MPPNFGTSIDDQTKLDIVAYILQTNGYPVGPGELALTGNDLATRADPQEGRAGGRPELFARADGRVSGARSGQHVDADPHRRSACDA